MSPYDKVYTNNKYKNYCQCRHVRDCECTNIRVILCSITFINEGAIWRRVTKWISVFFKKKAYRQDSRVKCSLCGSEFPVARGGRADIKGSLKISSRHKNGIDEWLFEINFYVSKVLNGVTTIWICPQLSLTTLQLFTISALILMFVRLNWCLHLSSLSLPSVKQSVVRLMFYASSLL